MTLASYYWLLEPHLCKGVTIPATALLERMREL